MQAAALLLALPITLAPLPASAGFFDFLFGNNRPAPAAPPEQPGAFADPAAPSPAASVPTSGGRFTTYCVRSCDGRYFPLTANGGGTPAQMCQSFCPASPTRVYSGNSIDYAVGANGERYVDSANAFLYRKTLKANCTCNGRNPAGLAPVDLSLDTSLRPGDVVATASGLVAYSGTRTANGQTAEFTPVANYPGLTPDVRARLGEMKVAPVSAELSEDTYSSSAAPETTAALPPARPALPAASLRGTAAPHITAPKSNRVM
jgi:hypothetical protein